MNMKESIILPAWETVTQFHSLKKLNFIPSLVGMMWLFLILIYQITFTYVYVFKKKDEVLSVIAQFAHTDYFIETIIALGAIFLFYIFLEPVATGGIIQMIDSYKKSHGEKPHRTFQGFFDGMRHFLPIFEVQNLTSVFRPLSVITFYILLLRLFGKEYFMSISVTMGLYLVFSFFLNMCFAYSKFFIIFEEKRALESLSASTALAVRHIHITGKLYFSMILLYLRTILVALLFLVLPFIVSGIIAFFTILSIKMILLGIFWIISLVLFIFIVHLNSTLEIFVEATWYEAYMLCKKEDKEYSGHHEDHTSHDSHGHGNHDNHGNHNEHHH
jgi:hypothetical protein